MRAGKGQDLRGESIDSDSSEKGWEKGERDRALRGKSSLSRFGPSQDHQEGRATTHGGASKGSRGVSRKLWLPLGLDEDVDFIVERLDIWHNRSDFMRDAVRQHRDRWITEARGVEKNLEKDK